MTEQKTEEPTAPEGVEEAKARAVTHVAPSPHLSDQAITTKGMMRDVVIGLIPVVAMSIYLFRWYAVLQIGLCVIACMGFEALFTRMRGKRITLNDWSAAVTGVILGLSLPWSAPWHIPVIASLIAIGLGKTVFGGLGFNLFNPAMVGRAFVMLSFARELGASAYATADAALPLLTQATPLTAAKAHAAELPALFPLFIGNHNGSLGESSILAVLVGGLYICWRRSASWEIPAGALLAATVLASLAKLAGLTTVGPLYHLTGGALVFGAFFIATDPVSSPLSPRGKFVFGIGFGTLTLLIRVFSGYPEGVMFAVLLMNATVPLINQWTIPQPLGLSPKAPKVEPV